MLKLLLRATLATPVLVVAALAPAHAAEPLVDPAWLQANLDNPNVVVLDVRDPAEEGAPDPFPKGHIPGAVSLPYVAAKWRTTVDGVPGMLPAIPDLESLVGGAGIEADDHLVIVSHGTSSSDFGSASRVFWTLEVLGHDAISILEGGHGAWVDAGGGIETGPGEPRSAANYAAEVRPELVATRTDVKAAQASGVPLVDARPVEQYAGAATPENVGIAGTIEGAVSLPHNVLVVSEGRDVIDAETLARLRAEIGLADSGEQIAFCNTGHWASIGWFLLNKVGGNPEVRLYDGSMVEWAKVAGEPVELGADRTVAQN